MRHSFLLIPFLFFFLIFFIHSVNAYTLFTLNPTFDNNANYAAVFSSAFINPPNYQWSSSCYGLDGCLNITTDNYTNIQIYPYDQNVFYNTSNSSTLAGHNYFILPRNEEGIAVLQYRATQNFYGYEGVIAQPKLYVIQMAPSYSVLNDTSLIPLNDTWYNYTVFVPAVSYDRNISVIFGFSSYQPPTEFDIDKFKFYTYDVVENREDFNSGNTTIEQLHYCGNDSIKASNFAEASGINQALYSNDTSENLDCDIFKIGNVVIVRRPLNWTNISYQNIYGDWFFPKIFYVYRDFYVLRDIGHCDNFGQWHNTYIFNKLSYSNINAINMSYWSADAFSDVKIITNGLPVTAWNLLNATSGVFRITTDSFIDENLSAWSNITNPTGTLWHISLTVNSSTYGTSYCDGKTVLTPSYPFFDYSQFQQTACTPHFECSNLTNNESYINADCSRTNQIYCGMCGCGSERCVNKTLLEGTFCDVNDLTGKKFYTYMLSGCSNYLINGTCGLNQLCVFHSSSGSNTIECFNNATGQHDYCINATGGLDVNCVNTTLPNLCLINGSWLDCTTEPVNQGIAWINNYIGMTGSFIVSLIVSFIISMIILFKSKHNGLPGFMVSMIICLGGFTYISMFPLWFFVIALSIIILGIYWSYKGGR